MAGVGGGGKTQAANGLKGEMKTRRPNRDFAHPRNLHKRFDSVNRKSVDAHNMVH